LSPETLGFIGLGSIGVPMASNLVAAGYKVVGFDVAGTGERLPSGAVAGNSVEETAAQVDTLFMSLPNGAASKTVCSQLARADRPQARIVVDLSTIGLDAVQECARLLEPTRMVYVDAPVSGGVPGARAGSLTVMVGAERPVFEKISPLLSAIAKNCFHMGDKPGDGQVMKLLNNFLSATALAATSEAVLFGVKFGLDIEQIVKVINASSGRNTASTDKFPQSVIPQTYDYGFAAALMSKDVDLYLESVEAIGTRHNIGTVIARTWRDFVAAFPDRDFTYVYKYLEGLQVRSDKS
jgi:3-hydroxyisobutyrate dehydrogenase-like beta-hydroxyacid dehydrogenase